MSQNLKAVGDTPEVEGGAQIYSLMSKVMADIGFISKDRKNTQQNYAFRGIDDVFAALQPCLIKHGVFFVPEVLHSEQVERQSKSGGLLIYTTMRVAYTFYAPDGSSVPAIVVGEAMDSGDKSSNKAMSAALKYAVLQIFCVPTEASDDADYHSPEPTPRAKTAVAASASKPAPPTRPAPTLPPETATGPATKAQQTAIGRLCENLKLSGAGLQPYLHDVDCDSAQSLTIVQAGQLIAMLQSRKDGTEAEAF